MINTKIMTTKEKKYIEKTLGILGLTIDDLLEVQNLKEIRSELEALMKEYQETTKKLQEYKEVVEKNSVITSKMSTQVQEALNDFLNKMSDDTEADN